MIYVKIGFLHRLTRFIVTVINSGKSLLNTFCRHSVIVRGGVEAEAHADEDGKGTEHEEEAPHDSARHLDVLCN